MVWLVLGAGVDDVVTSVVGATVAFAGFAVVAEVSPSITK